MFDTEKAYILVVIKTLQMSYTKIIHISTIFY